MDARQQFARIERFAQVVVGANFQSNDAVHILAFGCQHDDGGAVIGGTQASADRQTVLAGHHQVQYDQVHRFTHQQAGERLAVFGLQHVKPLLCQIPAQQVADADIVITD